MIDDKKKTFTINKGITANVVSADVIAVGDSAKAIKTVNLRGYLKNEILGAIEGLREEFSNQISDAHALEQLEKDVRELEELVKKDDIDQGKVGNVLGGLAGKLNMVKSFLSDATSIGEHVKKIAGLLKIPLSLIGLPF